MMLRSIRVRLTAWYAGLTLVALIVMTATVLALVEHSLTRAADDRLQAHHQGLARFSAGLESELTMDEVKEEYREYADVSLGNALFMLTADDGQELAAPGAVGFADATRSLRRGGAASVQGANVAIAGQPYRAERRAFAVRGRTMQAVIAVPLGPGDAALARARQMLWWLLPAMTLVAAMCGYIVSGRALRPVDRLTRAAASIDVAHLQQRLDVPSTQDELQRLALTFNGVLDRLEAGVNNIARFTSEASHELRTPVARVRTTAELALRRERTPDEYRQALVEIHTQSQEMSELVDDLLTVARADADAELPPTADVDVCALVIDWVAAWPFASPAPTLRYEPTSVRISADPRQLRRLLHIVCENAVKYSLGGDVHLVVRQEQGVVVIDVDDAGMGVAETEQARVFERFYRGTAARASDALGSGLGLAIAELIVRRHHGTIALISPIYSSVTSPGTRVRMSFPVSASGAQ